MLHGEHLRIKEPNVSTSMTYQSPWAGVAAIALGAFALVVMEFLPVGLMPGVVRGFGVSEGIAGLMVTATAVLGFVAAPLTALWVGRIDRRTVLLALTALVVVSGVLSSTAPNFTVLLIARLLLGIGVGGFWSISITAAARLVPRDQVHKASALVFSGISVASVVAVPLGSFISSHYDWRIAFVVATVLAASVLLLQIVSLPGIAMEHSASFRDFQSLLKSRKIIAIYLTIIFIVAGHFAAYTFVAPWLQQLAELNANTISILLLVYGVLAVAGNFAGGALAGRNVQKTVFGTVVLMLGSLVAMSALPHVAIIGLLAWAIAWGMAPVGTQLWLYDATKHAPEAAQSMNTSVFQLSITLGSLLGGVVVDHVALRASFWLGAGIVTIALIMVVLVSRFKPA
jgi:predicted MFS family arabinose efflux permease